MKKYLLDTNICIFLLRGKYEIDEKINAVGLHRRMQDLDKFIASVHVLPIVGTFDLFASEKARLRLAGTPADDNFDLLIGCTAVLYDLVMVTENLKDFKNISHICLENWIER